MMYKHGIKALVIVSAHLPCEAELSTLEKPVPLGVTHADSEMLGMDKLHGLLEGTTTSSVQLLRIYTCILITFGSWFRICHRDMCQEKHHNSKSAIPMQSLK